MLQYSKIALLAAATAVSAASTVHAAAYTWNPDASDNIWHNPDNWLIDGEPANSYPSSLSDSYNLGAENSVVINAPGAAGTTTNGSSGSTVTIDDGGVFSTSGANGLRYVRLYVNDGGVLIVSPSTPIRSNVTIAEGGTMVGSGGFSTDSRILRVEGSWQPLDTVNGSNGIAMPRGSVYLTTGQIVLDVFADGVSEHFAIDTNGASQQTLRLYLDGMADGTYVGGTILLQPQGGYVPQVGDSFQLVTVAPPGSGFYEPTLRLGDGSNIILEGYTLDTSRWNTDLDGDGYPDAIVTVVPEPAALSLAAVAGAGLLIRRRRTNGA